MQVPWSKELRPYFAKLIPLVFLAGISFSAVLIIPSQPNEDSSNYAKKIILAALTLIVTVVGGALSFHYDKKKDECQWKKEEEQKRKSISSTHSSLISIIDGFEKLRRLLSQEESKKEPMMGGIVNDMKRELTYIDQDADARQYFDTIQKAISELERGNTPRAWSIYESLKHNILDKWWGVRIERPSIVKEALESFSKNWIIVHGAIKASRDAECAKNLSQKLEDSRIMTDAELEASQGNEWHKDIISIGGSAKNSFVRRLNYTLPIQYVAAKRTENKKEGALYSLIDYRFYEGYGNSAIQVIRNPYNERGKTVIVLVFGMDRDDTNNAVTKLIDIIENKDKKLVQLLLNAEHEEYPARIFERS